MAVIILNLNIPAYGNVVRKLFINNSPEPSSGGGGGYSLIWAMWGRAAGQGMVFGLAVLNRVYNLSCLCPKQGMVLRAETLTQTASSLFLFLACELGPARS